MFAPKDKRRICILHPVLSCLLLYMLLLLRPLHAEKEMPLFRDNAMPPMKARYGKAEQLPFPRLLSSYSHASL